MICGRQKLRPFSSDVESGFSEYAYLPERIADNDTS
jgi:hypothetical protein